MDTTSLTALLERLDRIESRLRTLEGGTVPSPTLSAPNPTTPPRTSTPPPTHTPRAPSISAGTMLGAVGAICFFLGSAFIVKLAVDSGWLTPFRQWGLLFLIAASLVAAGTFLKKKDNDYAGYASGMGLVILFMAAYSGPLFFHVIEAWVGVVLSALVSITGIWLFKSYKSTFFALALTLGTYFTPILLKETGDLMLVSAYFLIWTAVFAWIAGELESRLISLTAAYFGIGIYSAICLNCSEDQLLTVVLVQAIQFFLLAAGVARHSIARRTPLRESEAWAFFPVSIFFYATEYYFLNRLLGPQAPWVSLSFAAIMIALYLSARSRLNRTLDSGHLVGGFAACVFFHAGYLEIIPHSFKPYLLPLFLLVWIFTPTGRALKIRSFPLAVISLIGIIEYGRISLSLLENSELFPAALMSAGLLFTAYFRIVRPNKYEAALPLLVCIHVVAILAFYRLAYDTGSLAVTGLWAIYSASVLAISFMLRDWALARSSLIVLLFVAGKALLYDASKAPSGVRIVTLLLTGGLLYGAGYLFRRIAEWEKR